MASDSSNSFKANPNTSYSSKRSYRSSEFGPSESSTHNPETGPNSQSIEPSQNQIGCGSLKTIGPIDFLTCKQNIQRNLPSICYCSSNKLVLLHQEEKINQTSYHFSLPEVLTFDSRLTACALSYDGLLFASNVNDQIFLCKDGKRTSIGGHSTSINSLDVSDYRTQELSSTSDDLTCKIWNIATGQNTKLIRLKSPGVNTTWSKTDPFSLLMIAQQNGLIELWDSRVEYSSPVMVLHVDSLPVFDGDWSFEFLIGIAAGTKWYAYDIRSTTKPLESFVGHHEGITSIKFSNISRNLFATAGRFPAVSLWDLAHPNLPYTRNQGFTRIGGISWLGKTPCLISGGDSLYFHDLLNKSY